MMPDPVAIDHGRFLEAIQFEAELLVDTAHRTRPDAAVPGCPGLRVDETVRHVGSVYRHVASWLAHDKQPAHWQAEPDPGQSVENYLRAGLAELLPELSAPEPDAPADTWWPQDPTVGFWQRRMAHETIIHRTDMQSAAGVSVTHVADDLALDGIDEALRLWFGHRLAALGVTGTREGSVALHAGGHTWLAHANRSQAAVRFGAQSDIARADAHISAQPMSLYLWLWGRTSPSAVTTQGDDDAVAQLWALMRLATR